MTHPTEETINKLQNKIYFSEMTLCEMKSRFELHGVWDNKVKILFNLYNPKKFHLFTK